MVKKIFVTLLTALLILPIVGVLQNKTIETSASELYPMACSIFEVSDPQDDGSFKKVSCHDSFSSAKKAMKADEDYVVRLSTSLSPMKIVAMNRGYAYTYPYRSGSSTMHIYYEPSWSTTDTTYVGIKGIEMTYLDTYSINESLNGYGKIQVILNGFKGYCDLEYTDLVPYRFVKDGIACYLGGNDNTSRHENPYKVVCKPNYYILKKNGNYLDIEFHYYYNYPKSGTEVYSYSNRFGSGEQFTNFMSVGTKYYSNDGINFYSDMKLSKYVGSTYSYYLFLPVRSRSNIDEDTFDDVVDEYSDSVMRNKGDDFIEAQEKYGVNALILFAMGCHESAYGTSNIAKSCYNLFGWNALDSNPDAAEQYKSVSQCIYQQAGYNLRKYLDRSQGMWYGECLGTKGAGFNVNYASDPYWGYKIASIAYETDKSDNNNNGNLTDYGTVNMGVITEYNCALYSSSSTSSKVYYNMKYRSNHFNDYTAAVVGEENGMYKIMSTNPITSKGVVIDLDSISTDEYKKVIEYDWKASTGYIKSSSLTPINFNGSVDPQDDDPNKDVDPSILKPYAIVNELNFDSDDLYISGVGAIYGLHMVDEDKVSHVVTITDVNNTNNVYSYVCDDFKSDFDMNDGYRYTYSGYEVYIPICDLPSSSYQIKLVTTYDGYEQTANLSTTELEYRDQFDTEGDYTYRLKANSTYNYRLELDIFKTCLDYQEINKPSKRDSLATYNDIYVDENNKLHIEGLGYIFYTDFDDDDDIDFNIYLVSNNGCRHLTTYTVKEEGYAELFGIDYNMDYIGFDACGDVSDLDGEYSIILTITNGSNFDICEICDSAGYTVYDDTVNGIDYCVYASNVRGRLMIDIED